MDVAFDSDEIRAAVGQWHRALRDGDIAASEAMRDDRFVVVLPDGTTLSKAEELSWLRAQPAPPLVLGPLEVRRNRTTAIVEADLRVGVDPGDRSFISDPETFRVLLSFVRADDSWQIISMRVSSVDDPEELPAPAPTLGMRARSVVPSPLKRTLRRALRTWVSPRVRPSELFLPYLPGHDYAIVPLERQEDGPLPLPPRDLWEGYHGYERGGARDVETMLAILRAGGFAPEAAGRILDLGCAAGRMIRHLEPLADRCEIWGTDISARHMIWCKGHLSPPFHFATTTTQPHLPFADGSFGLIYCGSLFTHIDDLADAWLLELARLLRPGAAFFVTIHDEYTVEQFEQRRWVHAPAPALLQSKVYRESGGRFDMLTVGRGAQSQVFYARDHFVKMASPAFELVSVEPGAYSCQTALLFRRTNSA